MWLLQSSNNFSPSDTVQSERYRFAWIPAYKEECSSEGPRWSSGERGLESEKGHGVGWRSGEQLVERAVLYQEARDEPGSTLAK